MTNINDENRQVASASDKSDQTIRLFFQSFGTFFRTFGLVSNPAAWGSQFTRLVSQRTERGLMSPLSFLGVSAFLLSIALGLFDDERISSSDWDMLKWFRDNAAIDISITKLLVTILPVFCVVAALAWVGSWILVKKNQRKVLFDTFCYVFGFFGSAIFILFLANVLRFLSYTWSEPIWQQNPNLHTVLISIFAVLLLYVVLRSFVLPALAVWSLNTESWARRILLSPLAPVFIALMIVGSFWARLLPMRVNAAIAERTRPQPALPAIIINDWDKVADVRFASCQTITLRLQLVIVNPRDHAVVINRYGWLDLYAAELANAQVLAQSLPLEAGGRGDILLSPKETRIIECLAVLQLSDYQKMIDRTLDVQASARWAELTRNGLAPMPSPLKSANKKLNFYKLETPAECVRDSK